MVLRIEHLDVVLGETRVLTDVSLNVRAGEAVALLGANGSGKSTLVRAALGVVPRAAGAITLFDQPLGRTVPWDRIGYVPQRLPASTGVPSTACEVVRSGLLSGGRWRLGSKGQAIVALQAMGMADRASQPVQEMSGGQQRRVLIARALIRQPELLVLDEPTTGIDLDTMDTLVGAMEVMRRSGTAMIVILHETEAFGSLLNRAIVLREGHIVHDGAPPRARGEHAEWQRDRHRSDPEWNPPLGLDVRFAES